jgi:hypothetical protein
VGSSVILPPTGQPDVGPDPNFKTLSTPNIVSFGFKGIGPPSNTYIQRDDILVLAAASSIAGESVNFTVRILQPHTPEAGQPDAPPSPRPPDATTSGNNIQVGTFALAPAALRAYSAIVLPLQEGYLLDVTANPTLALNRGRTYASAVLKRSSLTVVSPEQALFADYVTTNTPAFYPGGRFLHLTEGPGFSRSLNIPNPAAGADFSLTLAAAQRLSVKSFNSVFTASAAVANRNLNIVIDDGVNVVWQDDVSVSVTAGQAVSMSGAMFNQPTGVLATVLFVSIPSGLYLEPGWRFRSFTGSIQAADQWSGIWLAVEEWMDGI